LFLLIASIPTYSTYLLPPSVPTPSNPPSYIHGGYWCNPRELAWTFTATRAMLLTHPSLKKTADQIAGYASLNYRLSPHADFPQDRGRTASYEMRDARHPDHINDVLCALRDLQRRHGFGGRYLLLGHGVGATMALQVAMGRNWGRQGPVPVGENEEDAIKPPIAIIGIDGIYDMPLLRNRNIERHRYQTMIEGALGSDEALWKTASPAGWARYKTSWREARLLMLVHSREDELVDWSQVEAMERCWSAGQEGDEKQGVEMTIREIRGRHAEIWQKGHGMAGCIAEAIMALRLGEDI
jgi:kynurenine formamidase